MAIRITQGTLYSRALFDMQRGLFRYSQLQTEVATGRRVNRPSDDPAAALRILPLRGDIRDLQQLSSNVSLAREAEDELTESLDGIEAAIGTAERLVAQLQTLHGATTSEGTVQDIVGITRRRA